MSMSGSWATSITILVREMSGYIVTPSGWSGFMAGKAAMATGGTTPFAMTVIARTGTAIFSPGVTEGKGKAGRKLIAARMRPSI